jgi:hypothetical protein
MFDILKYQKPTGLTKTSSAPSKEGLLASAVNRLFYH